VVVRIFVVDDHELVRRGLRDLLDAEDDLEVVGDAATAGMALAGASRLAPDVTLLDVRLPDGSGIEVCREVRARDPRVACLMLTSFADDEALLDAIMAGAAGYLLKSIRGRELVDAVRRVATGESLFEPALTDKVLQRLRHGTEQDPRLAELSGQEQRILALVGDGLTNRQIAERMHLAEKTVKNYVSHLLAKLGMHRRTEAAVFYARTGHPR
jgi:two-component system, NarL family, response regulator DevR